MTGLFYRHDIIGIRHALVSCLFYPAVFLKCHLVLM